MIDVVINYDSGKEEYKIYESSTKTLLLSTNLSKGLISLNEFLLKSGLISKDIFYDKNIEYHLDSETMIAFISSNVELMKQLRNGPSSFSISNNKFSSGTQGMAPQNKFDISSKSFGSSFGSNSKFQKSNFGFGNKKWRKF